MATLPKKQCGGCGQIVEGGFKTLNDGDRVAFDVEDGPKGKCAKNVVVEIL